MKLPLLSIITFLPLAGALLIMFIPRERRRLIQAIGITAAFIAFAFSTFLLFNFDARYDGMQFIEKISWIPQINVNYFLGADGISIPLIFLTGLLSFLAAVGSVGIAERAKEYF